MDDGEGKTEKETGDDTLTVRESEMLRIMKIVSMTKGSTESTLYPCFLFTSDLAKESVDA